MPTPERVMGDSLKAAQEPDWDKVGNAAHDHAQVITALMQDRLSTASPDLNLLCSDIAELKKFVDRQLTRRFPDRVEQSAAARSAQSSDDGSANPALAATQIAHGKIAGWVRRS
jgi:type VI secretion system protein ImpA